MNYPKPLQIEATSESPQVHLDSGKDIFVISGRSLPENPHAFYEPVIGWVEAMIAQEKRPISLTIQLDYFNSSSGRYLLEMFQVIDKSPHVAQSKILWKVDEEDELMVEKGEEFSFLIQTPIEVITEPA